MSIFFAKVLFVITTFVASLGAPVTFVKPVNVQVPQGSQGEVNLKVSIPDKSLDIPQVQVTGTTEAPKLSIVDKFVESVQKITVKEGQTTTVVVPTENVTVLPEEEVTADFTFDWCSNLEGTQVNVPSNLQRDANGYCWPQVVAPEPVVDNTAVLQAQYKQEYEATMVTLRADVVNLEQQYNVELAERIAAYGITSQATINWEKSYVKAKYDPLINAKLKEMDQAYAEYQAKLNSL